ncbi:MAG: glycosyl transferase, family 2 [Bryobacterales bacterium]|nr:glycosyl transferase, family 2 [Bryobacterales bacterium]
MEIQILIADGMSTDGTRRILAEYQQRDDRILVIDNKEGFVSTGLNRAIRQADGEIIVRMDAHTEYAPDYIQACVEVLRQTGASNVGGPARTKAEGLTARAIAAAYHSPISTGGAKFHDVNYEGPVDTVTYGCWQKSTLENAGLFDEELVRNQDDELNLRLIRSGGSVWQSPRIVSWYRPRGAISSLWRQYFQYGFWKVAVIRKHRIPASWRHLAPGAFLLSLAALACLALVGFGMGSPALVRWSVGPLVIAIGTYLAVLLYAAWRSAAQEGFELFFLLPIVFGAYHFSYGSGFLAGLIHGTRSNRPGEPFTALTR